MTEAALAGTGQHLSIGYGRSQRPARRAVLASVLLHIAAIGGFWAARIGMAPEPQDFVVYRVNIVSPPPQVAGEPEPEPTPPPLVVTPPVEVAPPLPKPQPKPVEKPPEATKPAPAAEKPAPAKPVAGARPDAASAGGENLNVQMAGEEFPEPAYLENIIRQINRYFRWTGTGRPRVEVSFVILRDGSVRDIKVLQPSGNLEFDFKAMGAIEQAGKRGAFGNLPAAWRGDHLAVSFYFQPPQ